MSVRTFSRSGNHSRIDSSWTNRSLIDSAGMEPVPFSVPASACAPPLPHSRQAAHIQTGHIQAASDFAADEMPLSTRCLRGLCWALAIECSMAFCAFEAWHLWRILR
ncbi:MAG TPA: hypothetical protein VHX20_08320 [Terracidiphilus sp.]|jgi:hypothetical protein|nr:hypothetical protein [Terracidiphilus sp.]